jgi:protoporphyrinogen oxidase
LGTKDTTRIKNLETRLRVIELRLLNNADGTDMTRRTAIIIGAGPAGLTAALELLERSDYLPIVLQRDDCLGGISRTVVYRGNRMDLGGHRFFSKSDRVMNWWLRILPLESDTPDNKITYHNRSRTVQANSQTKADSSIPAMLIRPRKSRIYFMRRFFDYPVSLSYKTLRQLGLLRTIKIILSYLRAVVFPIRRELSLEDFLINRFGRELYRTFFKAYTEKVWGVPCDEISAAWGKQRIKGLSIITLFTHLLRKARWKRKRDIQQKQLETSLIENFLYPKLGPGQMWEEVGKRILEKGGKILFHQEVDRIVHTGNRITSIEAINPQTKERTQFIGDIFFSTMALQDFVKATSPPPNKKVVDVSDGLVYRDFITIGMLLSKLKIQPEHAQSQKLLSDNWIYIQEPDVKIGRLQIYNNWSPSLVADSSQVWIGLEYFCYQTDDLWKQSDDHIIALGAEELNRIGIIEKADILDATVVREPKTYPAYFGTYHRFEVIRKWLDQFDNLFTIGRNGMHRYNNQDHSMLTAMTAVDNILAGRTDKSNIWEVNIEQEYHEEKN